MKHTAVTFDNRRYVFDGSALSQVKRGMAESLSVEFPSGDIVKGSDIRRIEEGSHTDDYGPHLTGTFDEAVALIPEKAPDEGYRKMIRSQIRKNLARLNGMDTGLAAKREYAEAVAEKRRLTYQE